jgi:hypothetical protein
VFTRQIFFTFEILTGGGGRVSNSLCCQFSYERQSFLEDGLLGSSSLALKGIFDGSFKIGKLRL